MRYGVVYKITNLLDGTLYVGQTIETIGIRLKGHYRDKKTNSYLHRAMRKYGIENFTIEELFSAFSQDSLNEYEDFFIVSLNTLRPNGYNLKRGGGQSCHHPETKLKIGSKHKGKIIDDNYREKISRTKGGESIISVNLLTGDVTEYMCISDTQKNGFNRNNVRFVCDKQRNKHKNHKFYYKSDYQANQSGSSETKKFEHAQRIVSENYIDKEKFKKRLNKSEIEYIINEVSKGRSKHALSIEMKISRRTIYNVLNRI